jgi:hypothetical protein
MFGTLRGLDNFSGTTCPGVLRSGIRKDPYLQGASTIWFFHSGFRNVKNWISWFVGICLELDLKHPGDASKISQDHKPPAKDSLIPKTQWLSGWVVCNDMKMWVSGLSISFCHTFPNLTRKRTCCYSTSCPCFCPGVSDRIKCFKNIFQDWMTLPRA